MIAALRQVKTLQMDLRANLPLGEQVAAAIDWWRDAGVDGDLLAEPQNWLAEVQAAPDNQPGATAPRPVPPPLPAEPATPALSADALPADLPGFVDWWLAEPLLDGGRIAGRVAPRGEAGAAVMILVAHPERDDGERLLCGPQGKLLDAFLGAAGIAPERAYVASALPRHTPHADWAEAQARGLGLALARHIALVAPERLIVFGGNILPLLGNDLPNSADSLRRFNQGDLSVPLLAERDLAAFVERPRGKSGLWQRWLAFSR
ncbi:MAG: hypothetical protein RIQ46_13 [Pseudomonadota bacterium]